MTGEGVLSNDGDSEAFAVFLGERNLVDLVAVQVGLKRKKAPSGKRAAAKRGSGKKEGAGRTGGGASPPRPLTRKVGSRKEGSARRKWTPQREVEERTARPLTVLLGCRGNDTGAESGGGGGGSLLF